ncbi:MAG: InlB B-repeat-containing protein [Bacilli bacterium]|nr:InlB B-repeat-containing protein [Bacilli bacterium]
MFTKLLHDITKNKYYLIGIISVFLLLIITLGTAALRSTLSIVGTTKIQENTWEIYFDHVHDEQFNDNVTPSKHAVIIDNEKTQIEFTVDLKPGEVYEYTVDMINDGSINSSIEDIQKTVLSAAQKKYLDFDIIYTEGDSAGLEPKVCDKLNAGTKREIKISVRYKDGLDVSEYPSEDLHLTLFFSITYIKQDLTCPDEPTAHSLTIDPNGGSILIDKISRTDKVIKYLAKNSSFYSSTYEIPTPKRRLYNFRGWEVIKPGEGEEKTYILSNEPNARGNYDFTIGNEDVEVRAIWEEGNFVARIEDEYFETIQMAFDAADGTWTDLNGDSHSYSWHDNTVHLLRNTDEWPTNTTTTPFVFDLESFTVSGRITNNANSNLTLVNGRVEEKKKNPEDTDKGAVINHGTLALGRDDGLVDVENSIALKGFEIGLLNDSDHNSIFDFYDGYIEAERPIVIGYDGHPEGYYVFINHLSGTDIKRAYLVNNASRAVAKTETKGTVLYYDLQDAFDESAKNKEDYHYGDDKYIVYAIRDFEAAYNLSVPENNRVLFDTKGYKVNTGGTITNDGYLKIYNSTNEQSFIKPSKTIVNHGEMIINNLSVESTSEYQTINNDGSLDISKTTVKGNKAYAINNNGHGTIIFDEDTLIESVEYHGLYNNSPDLVITDGTIYGFLNDGVGTQVTGGTFKIYHWRTYSSYSYTDHFIPAIKNSGVLNISDGTVTEYEWETYPVQNKGTINISGGTFDSIYRTFSNNYDNSNGTITITGGNIHSSKTIVNGGNIIVANNASISSDTGKAIEYGYLEVNGGTVTATTGSVAYNSSVKITSGEIVSENGTAVEGNRDNNVTVTGGTIHSLDGTAIKGTNVNISGGTIEGVTYGIESGVNVSVTGGTITSDDKAVTCTSIDVYGGTITSPNDAVNIKNATVTGGTITSEDGTAITLSGEGTVLDGNIHGGMYGILNNGKLIIGDDEGTISPNVPTIIGDSVGVYITGTDTYFFDGILKGQVDGYVGEITRTPLGGTPASGSQEIDGVTYQTDYIIQFEPWLEIEGVGQFNTIDAASDAIADGGTATIKVIKDVVPSFVQHFVDENHNKQITFDLNGHILRSTQVAYNNDSNVTVIDSVGTGKITNDICNYFENDHNMTINNITIVSTGDKAAIRNYRHGTLTITNANITAHNNALQNMGTLIINNITLTSEEDAIWAEYIDELYDHAYGTVTINNGTITAGNDAVTSRGTLILNNGTIEAGRYGSNKGNSTTINGGSIHSVDTTIYGGSITVNGGQVISDTSYAAYTSGTTKVTNGYVEGTIAISHYAWYDLYSHPQYDPIYISGGKVVGSSTYGVKIIRNTAYITGGEVYGEVDGVYSEGQVVMGNKEDAISKTSPVVQGKHNGLTSTGTFYFFDGILKGKHAARDGQVNLVPDASMVIDDYEFIDRIEYKTEYLDSYGNWLRVGDQEFNSLYAAQSVIEDYGTVYVTKDVSINFEQSLVAGKHVTFDLDGHQVMMVKTLTTKGTNTVTDSSSAKTGLLKNVSEVEDLAAITNEGTLTIAGGQYESVRDYAISNDEGTMVINDINLVTSGCLTTYGGSVTINGGYFETTSDRKTTLNVRGAVTINGGTFISPYSNTIDSDLYGGLTINGGEIISTTGVAINTYDYYKPTLITGGTITGKTNGIVVNNNKDNHKAFTVQGGHIIGQTGSAVVSESDNTNITGGILEGFVYGLDTKNNVTIGTDDGTVSIDSPVIKGNSYGLNIQSTATVNFYDGILKGIEESEQGTITTIAARTQEYRDTETIDNVVYKTKYLITEKDLAYNVEQDKYYNNLQDAFDDAGDNEHIELLTNIPIYYPVTNNTNHPFTLDLKGYTISTNKPIVNNYNLTIVDSSNNGTIKASSNIVLITNSGTLSLGDISLINTGSSNYVVKNTGTLSLDQTKIEGVNALQNTNNLTINNANISASSNAIQSSGSLSIDGGTYLAQEAYVLYNNGSRENTISNAYFTGDFYNYRNTLNVVDCNITLSNQYRNEQSIDNAGTMNITRTNITGSGNTNNTGTMSIYKSTIDINGEKSGNGKRSGIYNTGTLSIDNTKVYVDVNNPYAYSNDIRGLTNKGTVTIINQSEIQVGYNTTNIPNHTYYGILAQGGTVTSNDSTITILGAQNGYGVYVDNDNASVILETGNITVNNSRYAYGVYATSGSFTMGHYDDVDDESDLVSTTNPRVYAKGDIRGIGVKRRNANFNFYDGIIWASTYAKPETTTHVEKFYEVTTYLDEATSLEYALLEFMGSDYDNTVVAKIGDRSYRTLQSAIDAENENNEEIILVRSIETDQPLDIPAGKNIVIDLHGMSLTTSINNHGTLQVYNGTIIEVGVDNPETEEVEDHNYINNYGTLIIGKDDGNVLSSNTRIISEGIAITNVFDDGYVHNEGRLEMYDGYIEGNPAIDKSIDKTAEFARLLTKKNNQYERIYLQSLSEDAIRNGETDLIVTIDPNGGVIKERIPDPYNERYKEYTEPYEVYLNYVNNQTYDITPYPTKNGCVFDGWEVSDPTVLSEIENGHRITIGLKDITLKAKWVIDPNATAKIGNNYYFTIEEAHEAAKNKDVIELIKDVTLDNDTSITITKEVTIDLGGHTISGNVNDGVIINRGILTIYNGTITNDVDNEHGKGIVNNKTLTMGINNAEVKINDINVFGKELGLEQNGAFNFYDGTIEGVVSIVGGINSLPQGYYLYTNENEQLGTTKLFLSGSPENAVAAITDGSNSQLFFKLTNAITAARASGKEIDIIKSFEANYPITIREDDDIVINMNSYDITTGNDIINNGILKIYDKSEQKGSITTSKPIENNGVLTIKDITISQSSNNNTLNNIGNLVLDNATIQANNGYAVNNTGEIDMNSTSKILATNYSLYNDNEDLILEAGEVTAIKTVKNIEINNVVINNTNTSNACVYANTTVTIDITGGSCTSSKYGILLDGGKITVNADNYKINASDYAIRFSSGSKHKLNLTDSEINKSENGVVGNYGIVNESGVGNCSANIKDSYVNGKYYGVYVYSNNMTIENSTVTHTITSTTYYALYCASGSTCTINNNTNIISTIQTAACIGDGAISTINDSTITAKTYGLYVSGSGKATVNNSTITGNTAGAYVYSYYDYKPTLTLNSGTISSENYGIYLYGSSVANLYGGTVSGDVYGIKLEYYRSNPLLNIGKEDEELSTTSPLVTGGLYGIYRDSGTMNFYNGKLRGFTNGYNSEFNNVRAAHDIVTLEEHIGEMSDFNTHSISEASDTPIARVAKINNGYARITYIDETNGDCINNTEYTFDYLGDEDILPITCPGKYSLEVWGAQGGYGIKDGSANQGTPGYGGYAYGEVNLNTGETLYINVGGRGENASLSKCPQGGYNGGGSGTNDGGGCTNANDDDASGAGGGATHIALKSGLLKDLENDKDKILIVAGGGGGAAYNYTGGSGGGFKGGFNDGTTQTTADQESGYLFGQGKNGEGVRQNSCSEGSTSCVGVAGGGGGWYGGLSQDKEYHSSGTGGSGYIGNTRLSNQVMFGYNVPYTIGDYYYNILVVKENFIQAEDGEAFNTIDDGVQYLIDHYNSTGKLTFIKDVSINEVSTVAAGTNIELDLHGKKVSMTQPLVNLGTLTISDNLGTGELTNSRGNTIDNQGTLTINNNVHLKSSSNVIYSNTSLNTITINDNAVLEGVNGVNLNSKTTLTVTNAKINASSNGIYITGGKEHNVTLTNVEINKDYDGAYAINRSGDVYDSIINITGGYYYGRDYSIYVTDRTKFTVSGAEIKSKSSYSSSYSALVCGYGSTCTFSNNTSITSTNAYGLEAGEGTKVSLTDTTINSPSRAVSLTSSAKMDVYNSTITGGTYGVYLYSYYDYNTTLNLYSGSITSSQYGIYQNSSSTVNLYGGSVHGDKYGVYQEYYRYINTLNIGDLTETTVSTTVPYITGGEYAVYKDTAKSNFYNGRLRGKTKGYNKDFDLIRTAYDIVEIEEYEDPEDTTSQVYKVNYLEEMQPFLVAPDGQEFNIFSDAIQYMIDNYGGTGKLTVTRSVTYQQPMEFPTETELELDLHGNELTATQTIVNKGITTISDSLGTGLLNNINGDTINNQGSITINNNAKISSSAKVINSTTNVGTVTVKSGAVLTGTYGIYAAIGQTVTMTGAEIKASNTGIYTNKTMNLTLTDTIINKDMTSTYGIRFYEGTNHVMNITGGYIRGNDYAIKGANISDGNIQGATLEAYNYHTIDIDYSTLNINAGTVINNYNTSTSYYAVRVGEANTVNVRGAEINAKSYGLNTYYRSTLNVYDGTKVYGETGAIYTSPWRTYSDTINIYGGEFTSPNIAANIGGNITFNIYGGHFYGDVYGLRGFSNSYASPTITIGDVTDTLDIQQPLIEGALYGIYKDAGTFNFYSGRLVGNTSPYYGDFDNVRAGHQVFLDTNEMTLEMQSVRTYNTSESSETPVSGKAKKGDGYVKITYGSGDAEQVDYQDVDYILPNGYNVEDIIKVYSHTTDEPYHVDNITAGYYQLEVWGAQGGGIQLDSTITALGNGGKGGYAKGTVHLSNTDSLYIFVGTQGQVTASGLALGGYNGGGATWGSGASDPAAGGGGATDIRINSDSLYSRVIVAGGGGGGGEDSEPGQAGGGLSGAGPLPGTQTAAGTGGVFGQGAHTRYDGGGAGGGWYGGGSYGGSQTLPTSNNSSDNDGGSGGSGYVYTSESTLVDGYLLDSSYQLINAELLDGNQLMTLYNGKEQTGNTGDGHARITYLGEDPIDTVTFSLAGNEIDGTTKTYSPGSKMTNLPTPTVDSEDSFAGWFLDPEFTQRVTQSTKIYKSTTLYGKVESNSDYCNISGYRVFVYDYSNSEDTFVPPCDGTYIIEAWGASGGLSNSNANGGYGGYSYGKIDLTKSDKLYINVGGSGRVRDTIGVTIGGYNGGANTKTQDSSYYASSGGGATSIAFKSGLLKTLSNDRDKIIMVAGGGGGATSTSSYNTIGGSGGGYHGGKGNSTYDGRYAADYVAYGGTQIAGGYSTYNSSETRASFGQGAVYTSYIYPGGGGGFYGGGTSRSSITAAGGGSGYIGNSRLYDKSMYGYNVDTISDAENATIAYLVVATPYIHNITQDATYTDLNLAFNQAHDNDELELTANGNNTVAVTIPDISLSLDMKGFSINTTKPITNNGNLIIVSNNALSRPKIYTNLGITLFSNNGTLTSTGVDFGGYNAIVNTGTINITNSNITTSNRGIENSSIMTLDGVSIRGGTYALYDSATITNTITNSTLSGGTSLQKQGTGRLTISSSNITGTINNAGNSLLIIQGGTLNGTISNSGTFNMSNVVSTHYRESDGSYNQISNSGTMTLTGNTFNRDYKMYGGYTMSTIKNTGTLNSSNNTHNSKNDYYYDSSATSHSRYTYNRGIINEGIVTSTSDTYNLQRSESAIAIHNKTNNSATVSNITGNFSDCKRIYALDNETGTMDVTGGSFTMTTNYEAAYGLYVNGGSITSKNVDITATDNKKSYGIYSITGSATYESGTISLSGDEAYGVYIETGTVTLGVQGSGVIVDNPYVEAIGTTTGYGVIVGDGSFNYYDGKILGSTNYRDKGFTNIEDDYKIQEIDETNGKACVLVSIY